ncbi:tripartite tricarboxylate transporter substrate binding protein [uncultured Alsobacter sp.]|uniref:Bug family tripartite tricarboxylate transporter substrate binding protein n=1 Tax=uncultured Alsobacter sp. TaxID=1748258 RepID=UPI0025E4C2E7|nr:tripartite tricarboxylate transporter substrate binding protein [uncultured Alsobacter sp.]
MGLNRRAVLAGLGASSLALTGRARAQAPWAPSRPIRLVVAYPAGGPTDVIARIVAQDLSTVLGQNVIVENVGGAAGALGTRQVARAEPDGHVITFGNNQTHGNNMFMLKEPGYDAVKDFAPLAGVGAFEHVFVVRKDLPAASIGEVIKLAKDKPGELNYGSTGIGSGSHLSTELFMARTGIKMTHVPYRGAAQLVQDMIGGRIDIANSTLPSVIAQVQDKALRGVAIGSPKRNAKLPDVPTLSEQGITGADASSWTGFFAPAATPKPAQDRLSREIMASLRKPDVVSAIEKLGFTIDIRDPEAFRPYQIKEIEVWTNIAKAAGIKPEEG